MTSWQEANDRLAEATAAHHNAAIDLADALVAEWLDDLVTGQLVDEYLAARAAFREACDARARATGAPEVDDQHRSA